MATPQYAWCDGLVPWAQATCHVSSAAFKYGAGVFEGIRAYWNADHGELYVWQLDAHLARLEFSQRAMAFESIFSAADVRAAVLELLRANAVRHNVHITTTIFLSGPGQPFVLGPTSLAVTALERGDYANDGVSVQVSSWRRSSDAALPQRVKANGNYLNGRLAAVQAKADGYDTALMLTQSGKVSEGPAMCFFMVRDGVVITPDLRSDILESITRATVIALLREDGVAVEERAVDRSELMAAQEAFFCGTAWEIAPITSIDRRALGAGLAHEGQVGPVVNRLRARFAALTTGADTARPEWRTPVWAAQGV